MKQFLLTKHKPFYNDLMPDCYDEQKNHEILNLKADSLEEAARILGFVPIIRHYRLKPFIRYNELEDVFWTLSEWTGKHEIGLFFPHVTIT